MAVNLHGITLSLRTADSRVRELWQNLFDYELEANPRPAAPEKGVIIDVEVNHNLSSLPEKEPDYRCNFPPLLLYSSSDQLLLVPSSDVRIKIDPKSLCNASGTETAATIELTPAILDHDGFEDILSAALAPFLRRHGFYMVHAFAASSANQAVMFSGPRGHGKTTAGLSLIGHSWNFLANDVAILCDIGDIAALLSPGTVHAAPDVWDLLPQLAEIFPQQEPHHLHGKVPIPRAALLAAENPVQSGVLSAVYFPEIGRSADHRITLLPRAVGLARLMESSMDQWDRPAWEAHVDFLERLSRQVNFYKLILGQDLSTLAPLIEKDL